METKAGDLEGLVKSSTTTMENEKKTSSASESLNAPPAESVPDPDEDDLDDLDGKPHRIRRLIYFSTYTNHNRHA
jgi:hypothetical protein